MFDIDKMAVEGSVGEEGHHYFGLNPTMAAGILPAHRYDIFQVPHLRVAFTMA